MTAVEQGALDLDGDAISPEAEAVAAVLGDLDGKFLVYGGEGRYERLALRIVEKLREEHRLRLAPIERPPVALALAAGEVENLVPRHRAVFDVLVRYGQLPDHDLVAVYGALLAGDQGRSELGWEIPAQAASSIRSRRKELVRAGLVEDSGLKVGAPGGGRAKVWRIVRP